MKPRDGWAAFKELEYRFVPTGDRTQYFVFADAGATYTIPVLVLQDLAAKDHLPEKTTLKYLHTVFKVPFVVGKKIYEFALDRYKAN